MGEELLLGIDIGTSSVRCCLFEPNGRLVGTGRTPYETAHPEPGWAEVDPEAWWKGFLVSLAGACDDAGAAPGDIAGAAVSTLFPTMIALGPGGEALGPALLYCDQRSLVEVAAARASGLAALVERTGINRLMPGTCALSSLLWLRRQRPEIYGRAAVFGMVNTLFSMRLAGVASLDFTSGPVTGLVDPHDQARWDERLIEAAEVDLHRLPHLVPPTAVAGTITAEAARLTGLREGIPLAAGAGDAAAAPFGGGCIAPGALLYTSGSSDCLSVVADRPPRSNLVVGVGYLARDRWLRVGTSTSTGAALDWFARTFLARRGGEAVAREAAGAEIGAGGVTFLPYLQGERTPVWDADARGAFTGITTSTTRADLARAVLEGTAFALRQVVETVEREEVLEIPELPTAGGGARNALWNRIKADLLARPLRIFEMQEFSALGAAMLAGIAAGTYASPVEAIAATAGVRTSSVIEPDADAQERYAEPFSRYVDLYPRLRAPAAGTSRP